MAITLPHDAMAQLIACTGFYEWERADPKHLLPWFVTRTDRQPLVMAGIWQEWHKGDQSLTGCAVVTCAANAAMRRIHDGFGHSGTRRLAALTGRGGA